MFTEPKNWKAALEQNWHWCIVAVLMLAVITGVMDFNNPWFDAKKSTRGKSGWIYDLFGWFRTNPNTTLALAWLYLFGSLCLIGVRIRRGWARSIQESTENAE